MLAAEKVHADDTPVPVLDPGRGKTKTGRLWTYVRDDRPAASRDPPAVWYRYSPDRKGEHPQAHLRALPRHPAGRRLRWLRGRCTRAGSILEAACWAHARRKFYDLYMADRSPIAAEAMQRIGALYAIERDIRGSLPARAGARAAGTRRAAARRSCTPGCRRRCARSRRSRELAGAINYALVRWTALTRYRDDGRIEIDNNSAERAIRPLVLGRRNYLFAGSDAGGERAANIYSLIGTALLNGMDPYLYLRHVLERIAEHPINRIDELLPWHVAATRLSRRPKRRSCHRAPEAMAVSRKAPLRAVHASAAPIYQLRIELLDLKPAIWRSVLVPGHRSSCPSCMSCCCGRWAGWAVTCTSSSSAMTTTASPTPTSRHSACAPGDDRITLGHEPRRTQDVSSICTTLAMAGSTRSASRRSCRQTRTEPAAVPGWRERLPA